MNEHELDTKPTAFSCEPLIIRTHSEPLALYTTIRSVKGHILPSTEQIRDAFVKADAFPQDTVDGWYRQRLLLGSAHFMCAVRSMAERPMDTHGFYWHMERAEESWTGRFPEEWDDWRTSRLAAIYYNAALLLWRLQRITEARKMYQLGETEMRRVDSHYSDGWTVSAALKVVWKYAW